MNYEKLNFYIYINFFLTSNIDVYATTLLVKKQKQKIQYLNH